MMHLTRAGETKMCLPRRRRPWRAIIAVLVGASFSVSCSINTSFSFNEATETIKDENGPAIVRDDDGRLFLSPMPCGNASIASVEIVDAGIDGVETTVLDLEFDPPGGTREMLIPLNPFDVELVEGVTDVVVDEVELAAAIEGADATLTVRIEVWQVIPDEKFVELTDRFVVGELDSNQAFDTTNTLFANARDVECSRGQQPWSSLFDD